MKHLDAPCNDCPFLKKGGVRLRRERLKEIVGASGVFSCHKTVKRNEDDEVIAHKGEAVCGGFLIFMEKTDNANQMMRIGHSLGMYEPAQQKSQEKVFDSLAELLATAVDAPEDAGEDTGEPCGIANEGCEAPAGWSDGRTGTETAKYECSDCTRPVCAGCSSEKKTKVGKKMKTVRVCADCLGEL